MNRQVVIVGGGITGLSAAYTLASRRSDVTLTLLEARERVGGNIVTERAGGFLLDGGPDSFLRTKPHATELCKELGLGADLVTTREQARKVYMVRDGELEPMPAGMALAVPTRLRPMLETPLLSFPGKLRMLGDLVLPARHDEADESIEAFVARRFGREAAIRLAAPLLGGIYAGDIGELSVRATFPQLVELEQQHGSLVVGLFAAQRRMRGQSANGGRLRGAMQALGWMRRSSGEAAPSPFMSLRGGMGDLVSALEARLPAGCVRTRAAVSRIARQDDGRWLVTLEGGEPIVADAVLIAAPAHAAARMVPDAELSTELAAIPYLSTATVFFGWPRDKVDHPLDGVGFIAPKGQTPLIAATWVTSKWDERAPEGHVLVRAFVGGVRSALDVKASSDDELAAAARAELTRLMGPLGEPELTRVFRYVDSNPQPLVGHPARLARIAERLERLPGLYVAGAAYDGVGIPDCVRQGRTAAERISTDRC